MTMKSTTPDKMDITPVATIKEISKAKHSSNIVERKTTTYTKGTKRNERKTPAEDRSKISYDEMNIEDNFLKKIEHGTEMVFKTIRAPPL